MKQNIWRRIFYLWLLLLFVSTIYVESSYPMTPIITSVSPNTGSTDKVQNITVTGTNFEQGAKATLLNGGAFFAGAYDTTGYAYNVYVSGNYAYIADGDSGLQVIDISSPSSPVLAGSYDTSGESIGVYVSGNYAYIADGDSGLQVIDISSPSSPVLTGSYDTSGESIGVYVSGRYAYIADGDSGLQVIDISSPNSPIFTGSYNTSGYAIGVYVSGRYAYIADGFSGLQIIDISDPNSPVLAGSYDTQGYAEGVYVSGRYAYIADWISGLQIIDISDPNSPVLAGSYDAIHSSEGVYVTDRYLYIADRYAGLQIIDIINPNSPVLTGSYNTQGYAIGVYVSGRYAYIADGFSGLQIIDISDPNSPSPSRIDINISVIDSNRIAGTIPTGMMEGAYDLLVTNPMGEEGVIRNGYKVVDSMPPASVSDLAASLITGTSIRLSWSAPGDDGDIGAASFYDIRYSTLQITEADWDKAIQITGEPVPSEAGTIQTFTVTGLNCNTTYYFALKTSDNRPNTSVLSNEISVTTGGCIFDTKIEPESLSFGNVKRGSSKELTFAIYNNGTAVLEILELSVNSDQFQITSPVTIPLSIAQSGSERVTVEFLPTSLNRKNANIKIIYKYEDKGELLVALTGDGLSALDGNISTSIIPSTTNRVDGYDLNRLEIAIGSEEGDPNWDPVADINNDGIIDDLDFAILMKNFGKAEKF
ncbi:MAG: choice-of-anchor D domain-containing protein [Nitrospirota bacterium]